MELLRIVTGAVSKLFNKQEDEMNSFIKEYPELMKIARKIAKQTIETINKESKTVDSKMPYKAQFILEEIIKILEESV